MKKNTLSLGDRVKLIAYAKENPSVGTRKIADTFQCGQTQVQAILKAKESSALAVQGTRMWMIPYTSDIVWPESDSYQCQALAAVRSTTASKGARKRYFQGVQWLVAELQEDAQKHTARSMW